MIFFWCGAATQDRKPLAHARCLWNADGTPRKRPIVFLIKKLRKKKKEKEKHEMGGNVLNELANAEGHVF